MGQNLSSQIPDLELVQKAALEVVLIFEKTLMLCQVTGTLLKFHYDFEAVRILTLRTS